MLCRIRNKEQNPGGAWSDLSQFFHTTRLQTVTRTASHYNLIKEFHLDFP